MSPGESSDKLKAAWTAVENAFKQLNCGNAIEERCPFCDNLLMVDGLPTGSPTQWFVRCPCGKCNATLKGL
jgi:hypothetical protein